MPGMGIALLPKPHQGTVETANCSKILKNVDLSLCESRREAASLAYHWLFEPARSSKSVLEDLFSVD